MTALSFLSQCKANESDVNLASNFNVRVSALTDKENKINNDRIRCFIFLGLMVDEKLLFYYARKSIACLNYV